MRGRAGMFINGHLFAMALLIFIITSSNAFGAPTFTISGYVQTSSGTGVAGANVTGNNGAGSAVTGADGAYSVTVPNRWSGTIAVSKAGWLITPASKTYNRVRANIANENYVAYQPKISGYVKKTDGTALSGATVLASSASSATTNASGYYEIVVSYGWSGNIQAALTGYYFTAKNYTNVTTDQASQDFSGFQPTISGVITSYGEPLEGVTLTATNGGGTGVTDSAGSYNITIPYGWSGTITPLKPQYTFTPVNKVYSNITADTASHNYTAILPPVSISGYVRDGNGAGIANVNVTANNGGGSAATNSSGYYSISVPYNWSGTVTANKMKWEITPANYSYSNLIGNQVNQNFTAIYTGFINIKPDTTGDYPTIQAAIDAAINGDIILLQPGTYRGTGNRDIDFKGKAITVKGATGDPNDIVIDCQGTSTNPHRGFNFVRGETASAILEAIKIINGYGITENYNGVLYCIGGAIYCENSNPTVNKCVIYNNSAVCGGGVGNIASSPTINICTFTNNSASFGGGIYNFLSSPSINNCSISNNSATGYGDGGGIYNVGGSPSINICIISNNWANNYAGGIYNQGSRLCIRNCTISNNSGGGYGGGGIYNINNSESMMISNCTITNNSTENYGGGIWNHGGDSIIKNCIINNNAAKYGGGICNWDNNHQGNVSINNCIVNNNSTTYRGGGIYSNEANSTTINSSIIWGNQSSQVYGNVTVRYSDTQGGYAGIGNIDADPLFAGDGVHIQINSPCVNAGDPNYIPEPNEMDIDYEARVAGTRIDIGADEVQGVPMLSISGYAKTVDGTPLGGAIISANNGGGSTTTNTNGYYELAAVYNWNGTVFVSFAGYGFIPKTYTNIREDQTNQDFIGSQPKISGYVNRSFDNLPIADVNVSFSSVGVTATNASGHFNYSVPVGWSGTMSLSKAGIEGKVINFTNITSDTNSTYLVNLTYGGGTGDVNDPYRIETAEQMYWLSKQTAHWGKSFLLVNDINMNEPEAAGFAGIGGNNGLWIPPFSGNFDGGGHVIRNLNITGARETQQVGLFNCVYVGCGEIHTIKNLGLINPSINGKYAFWGTAPLIGRSVSVYGCTPGMLIVENCWSEGGKVDGEKGVGGLLGFLEGNITVRNCFANTAVQTNNGGGGLIGYLKSGKVSNCAAICDVNTSMFDAGGLIGSIYTSEVKDCYVRGVVRGNNGVGGFIARSLGGNINRCYADCNVSGIIFMGGFAGYSQESPVTDFNACFWDKELCPDVNGIGNIIDANVVGKTTEEMKTAATFTDAGWDFAGETANGTADIWTICEGTNTPKLVWQIAPADFICPDGVNFADFTFFAQQWLNTDCQSSNNCEGADIDESGKVDMGDLREFASWWLEGI